jgi:hypothetical protein
MCGRTVPAHPLSRAERATLVDYPDDVARPMTRGDCLSGGCNGERPCPFVSCKYHLYVDVNPDNGTIKLNFPGLELDQIPETCALDVADRGGITLQEIGRLMLLTRACIQIIEIRARDKLVQNRTPLTPALPRVQSAVPQHACASTSDTTPLPR